MSRLMDGYNYFMELKPSTFKPSDVIFLHRWMLMLKESVDKSDEPLGEGDLYLIAKEIFK